MFFEIGPPALRSGANGRGITFVDIPRGTGLEYVRTVLVERRQQQSHSVRTTNVGLRRALMPIGQIGRQSTGGHTRAVDVFVIEAFVPHPFGQGARVGGESRDADAEMIVDFENFLLMAGEFRDGTFERPEDGVRGGAEGDAGRSLFDRFHGIFDLVYFCRF